MNDASEAGILAFAAAMKGYSKHVVVIGDDDGVSTQPVDCLLASRATMASCTESPTADQIALNGVLAATLPGGGVQFMDTKGWFCFQGQCPMVVGTTIVYRDISHVTGTYVRELAGPFRSAFDQAIRATGGRS
jgi:hypothetical protein